MIQYLNILKKTILISVFVLVNVLCFGQSRKDLENQKNKTQRQIRETSKLLNETKKVQKKSYNNLLLLNKQISSRKELIDKIREEINMLNQRIQDNETYIEIMSDDLEKLKASYAKMVQNAYEIKNSQDRLIFILSAKDFNQAYKRLAYLKELTKFRQEQAEAIVETKEAIKQQNLKLDTIRQDKLSLLTEEEQESAKLYYEVEEQNSIIKHLKTKESVLRAKLRKQKQQADKLQREIERLIASEAKKTNSATYEMTPGEKLISKEFGNNKKRLPWPVESGVVTGKFGKQPHPVLKNVYVNNNGVDISTAKGSAVRAIFDGEVRKVFKVPGYQNAVIVRHGSYLSTYTHLESVYVAVGDKVKAKQSIGSVHTDVNNGETMVHLEIWYGQKVLNPEQWLAK